MDHLASAFEQRPAVNDGPNWLKEFQESAWQRASAHGLPWRKDEHWKYTSLYNLAKIELTVAPPSSKDGARHLSPVYTNEHATVIHWQNGRPSVTGSLPQGVAIQRADSEASFLNAKPARESVMQDLNHAFADDIVVITIESGTRLDKPLYFTHSVTGQNTLSSQRLHVVVGDNCEIDLLDHLTGTGSDSLNNRRLSMVLGANSHVRHTQIQQEDASATLVDDIDVVVGRDSHYLSHVFDLGAALARHDLGITLSDSNAHCTMLAAYLPHNNQHVDHHTLVKHSHPHTHSEQRYHGVAGAKGHGVFNGKVLVEKDAQKITAAQSNQNILLCEQAAIDTKPELEIYADDVKCSHGATVGQLDENSLFYLQSRGLDRNDAQQLLVRGFIRDIYADIQCPTLHGWLDSAISDKLDQLVEQLP